MKPQPQTSLTTTDFFGQLQSKWSRYE